MLLRYLQNKAQCKTINRTSLRVIKEFIFYGRKTSDFLFLLQCKTFYECQASNLSPPVILTAF